MKKKKTRTVRVLFSVEVDVPLRNPNTMREGPGPYLHGFLEPAVTEQLSEAPGCAEVPWCNDIGDFKLHSVEERSATGRWLLAGTADYDKTRDLPACGNCDGSGCPDCDPCRPSVEKCKLKRHAHRD